MNGRICARIGALARPAVRAAALPSATWGTAREHEGYGAHGDALARLSRAVDAASGRAIPVNATGAVAALIADAGIPLEILRGIALISRCAGLVGHVREAQEAPVMRALWESGEAAVVYQPPAPKGQR